MKILLIIGLLTAILASGCTNPDIQPEYTEPVCSDYSAEECPETCVVCPPCQVCSSVSCQTEEFCNEIGFDSEWYKNVTKKIKESQ